MKSILETSVVTLLIFLTTGGVHLLQESRKTKQVNRVARPVFSKSDWDGIYFENLFEEGLVGVRPAPSSGTTAVALDPSIPSQTTDAVSSASNWTALISAETLEDEIKTIQSALVGDVTTPVRFRSEYIKSHRSFSMLSLLFAIISQYGDEVRWKSDAAAAQVSFWQAASNARVGTPQAFESCRRRLDILTEMIRGGKFTGDEKPTDDFEWISVVTRNPLMHRLETSLERLKQGTSNNSSFSSQIAQIKHESELVAAIGFVLAQETMTDADDEEYSQYALEMQQAAIQVTAAAKNNDFQAASAAVNRISQSCDNCHSDWR